MVTFYRCWGGREIELLAPLRSIGLPPSSPAKPVTSNRQTGVFPTPFLVRSITSAG